MKIQIDRSEFLKNWQMAERTSSTKSTLSAVNGVLVTADEKTLLEATDFKVAIRCPADGVEVLSPGSAILPIRPIGELLKKIPSDKVTIEINDEKGILSAKRSKTRFTTWPVTEFPTIPRSEGARDICAVLAGDLSKVITEGSIASSTAADFPKYLGACLFQVKSDGLRLASTDGRRLALAKCPCEGASESEMLLPVNALRELNRLLSAVPADIKVKVLCDGSLAWFRIDTLEFSVRQVESSFPNYEKILTSNRTTSLTISRDELLSALERLDIIVRTYTRLVILHLSPSGQLKLTGKAPELGTAVEVLDGVIDGEPLRIGFNVGYLQDGLKTLDSDEVQLYFNGEEGQMRLVRDEEENFLYMLMPSRVTDQDIFEDEEEPETGTEPPSEPSGVEDDGSSF